MSQCTDEEACCPEADTLRWALNRLCGCYCHDWETFDDEE